MTLTEFLLARFADDEAAANAVAEPVFADDKFSFRFDSYEADHTRADSAFVDRFDPARILAECEAKRAIIAIAQEGDDYDGDALKPWLMAKALLKALALPYADHPDYREEWKL